MVPAPVVHPSVGVSGFLITLNPGVDTRAAGPQQASNLGDGSAGGRFQDCQGATIDARIPRLPQVLFELTPLSCCECQFPHGGPPSARIPIARGRSTMRELA